MLELKQDVMDLPLCTVLFTMHHISGIQGAHQESYAHMIYALEAMAPTMFIWVEALIVTFKAHLTKCQ